MKSVIAVKFNTKSGRLLSYSKDKVLRIWNVHLQMAVYRLSNVFPKGPEGKVILFFRAFLNLTL